MLSTRSSSHSTIVRLCFHLDIGPTLFNNLHAHGIIRLTGNASATLSTLRTCSRTRPAFDYWSAEERVGGMYPDATIAQAWNRTGLPESFNQNRGRDLNATTRLSENMLRVTV